MTVYLRRRPLSLRLVVHVNIPLRLPLRNAIRQSIIHRRSIAASAPLLLTKAREGAGALLLLRPQCCTVAAAVVPLRNAIRQSIIHQRSSATSAPPSAPTQSYRRGGGLAAAAATVLNRRRRCGVAQRFRTITMTPASVLLYKCHLRFFFLVQIYLMQCA